MATTNAMFTITDTGDLNGRNLLQRSFFTKDPWTGPTYNAVGEGFGTYHDKYCLPVNLNYIYVNTNNRTTTVFPELTFDEGVQYTFSGKWAQFRTDNVYTQAILRIIHTDGWEVSKAQPKENNAWSNFTITSKAGKTIEKITISYSRAGTTYFADLKLEVGAAATDWTPAPEDMNTVMADAKAAQSTADNAQTAASNAQTAADNAQATANAVQTLASGTAEAFNEYLAGTELIVGTQANSTEQWTGKASFSELKDGQRITYWLPYAGTSDPATLELTLNTDPETTTGPINVYYRSTTRATTHFGTNTPVVLTYRKNAKIGTSTIEGWWGDYSYYNNTNNFDRLQHNRAIKIKTAFTTNNPILVSDDDGYFVIAANKPFDMTMPILYYASSTNMSAGGTTTAGYISYPTVNLHYTKSGITLSVDKACYIVGTISGSMFTPVDPLFVSEPVTGDTGQYYYMSLGYVGTDGYTIYLYPEHPLFKIDNGVFKSLNLITCEARVAADEAKSTAESKNSVYYQATTPTAHKVGDTWFNTADGYKISRWDGITWAAAKLGNQAVGNLDASHINTGTLTAVHIEAGKSEDIAGTIKVYDEADAVKVSLDKDGLMATKGTIGGWDIDETSLSLSVPYQYNNSGEQVTAYGDDTELVQFEDTQLVGASGDDTANISLLTFGRDQSDGLPYILCDDGALDGSTVRIKNGKISCLKNDNTLTNGISTYIRSDAVLLSETSVVNDITNANNVRLKPDRVEVLYTPDYEQGNIDRAILTHNDLFFSNDDYPVPTSIVHWSIFSYLRTIKGPLQVTVYHCMNLFWAHFSGTIPAGWNISNTQDVFLPIVSGDTDLSNSVKVAPPQNITKFIIPSDPTNRRISVVVRSDGQLGISRVAEPLKGDAATTFAGYIETCDIFWAHIG